MLTTESRIDATIQNRLRQSSLCRDLSNVEFNQLFADARLLDCNIGTVLCSETMPLNGGLLILLTGKLRLFTCDQSGHERTIFNFKRTGDFYGGISDSTLAPNLVIRASTQSSVIQVTQQSLNNLKNSNEVFRQLVERETTAWYWHSVLAGTRQFEPFSSNQLHNLLNFCQAHLLSEDAVEEDSPFAAAIVLEGVISTNLSAVTLYPPGSVFWVAHEESGALLKIHQAEWNFEQVIINADQKSTLLVITRSNLVELAKQDPDCVGFLMEAIRRTVDTSSSASNSLAVSLSSSQILDLPVVSAEAQKPAPIDKDPIITALRRRLHKYPHIFQQSSMDCGAASLAMVALFYGKRLDLNRIQALCRVGAYGTSLMAIAEASEKLGFLTQGMQANYEGLQQVRLPCICYWAGNHFVVLYEIGESSATIGDPAEGILTIPRQIFEHHYSGAALEIFPTVEFGKRFSSTTPIMALLPLFSSMVPHLRSVFLASFLLQALLLAIPMFTQVIVDKVVVHQNLSMLTLMLVGMFICCVFEAILSVIRGYLLSFVAIKVDQALIVQFYKHLLSLPLKFFEERSTGDLISRFSENQKIRDLLAGNSITVILDTLTVFAYLAIICCYNFVFGVAATVYVLLFFTVVVFYTPILKRLGRRVYNKHVESQSFLIESIRGIEKIKGASAETRTRWKWEILFTDSLNFQFKELLAINLTNALTKVIHMAGQISMLWLGANLVVSEKLTIGQFMALNLMVEMVVQPLLRVVGMWDKLQEANIAVERIGDVLQAKPEEEHPDERIRLPIIRGAVKFEGVTFRYTDNDERNTLSNISFEVLPGQMAAIVGRSGSGKSTILKLIQALYLPISGRVLIDGKDVANLSLVDLRKNIGVVSQHEYFFRGTVKENLGLYNPSASREEMIAACEIAGVHEVIRSLPMEYETPLSEGGFNLSGGQRQRLAIARSILHQPKFLIFDEATSALDSESERRIQDSMKKIRSERTMFVVAHRLSTVQDADIIFVIDRGQIVEVGTHAELVVQKGLYHHLCSQQLNL